MKKNMETGDFSQPAVYPYLLGAYACVNAVPGVTMLVDGPKCAEAKAEYLYGSGDLFSDLLGHSAPNRVVCTGTSPERMTADPESGIVARAGRMLETSSPEACLLAPMPLAAVAGLDYARALGPLFSSSGVPFSALPGSSLSGDWLAGYGDALAALAGIMPLGRAARRPRKVAVVGNPMYRREYDCLGNVRELESLAAAAGVELAVWPGGGSLRSSARELAGASAVIGLPHGLKAAEVLARRMGVPFVGAPLPFGLAGTGAFLAAAARCAGRCAEMAAVIKEARARVYGRSARLVSAVLSGGRAVCVIDPLLEPGLRSVLSDIGVEPAEVVHTSRAAGGRAGSAAGLKRLIKESFPGKCGLLISSNLSPFFVYVGGAYLEFGFPVYNRHCLEESPFLGYSGFLRFIEQAANTVLAARKDPPYVV